MLVPIVATAGVLYLFSTLLKPIQEIDENVAVINRILKSNLSIKGDDDKTIHAFVKSYKFGEYVIELPEGFDFGQLEKVKGKLENALKRNILISNNNFNYLIEFQKESSIPSVAPFQLINTKSQNGLKVAVGMGEKDIVCIDFKSVPHLLVAGSTGWGKSIFTKNLILQLLHNYPDVELELFDFKSGIELRDFKNLKQTKSFTIKPHLAEKELERIYDEIELRFDLINRAECRDVFEFNSKSKSKMQYKFVIIEEFTVLLDIQKDISNVLVKSLAIARATGIYFVFTSQRFDSKIIDSKIKANVDNRVCFHTADSVNSKLILDQSGAEKLNQVGRGLLGSAGKITEFQTFYVKKNDVSMAIKHHLEAKKQQSITVKKEVNDLWA